MPAPRRVLLTPVGSHGDVLPFLALGRTLAARGHEVILLAAAPFAGAAARAGLGFEATASEEEYEALTRRIDMRDLRRGLHDVMALMPEAARAQLALLERLHAPGRTTLVGHTIAWGARLFEERHGLPALTVHLAPTGLRTVHDVTIGPGRSLAGWPVWLKRLLMWGVDRFEIDRHALPGLSALRRELGLPPQPLPIRAWLNSPQGVLGLFPEWFAAPQPDWPARVTLAGFPLGEDAGERPAGAALEEFLAAGSPPVVVTPGSANRQALEMFEVLLAACQALGRRALLLTRYPEQVPAPLPPWAHQAEWAPLGRVLPRAAALVHHGGIGTSSQGLAAGVPQLVTPFAFDQPDNALRLVRLGVADLARLGRPDDLTRRLGALLERPEVPPACARWRAAMDGPAALARAADAVEALSAASRPG